MSYQLSFIETYERTPTAGGSAGVLEKGVILRNSNFVRRFGDSDWNKIRMACRFRLIPSSSLVADGVSLGPTANLEYFLGFGFCHGTQNVLGSQNIDNIHGVRMMHTLSTLTYNSLGYWGDRNMWGNYSGSSDVAVSWQNFTADFGDRRLYSWTSSLYGIMFDITKAPDPTRLTASAFVPRFGATPVGPYYTDTDWLNDISQTTPSRTNYTYYNRIVVNTQPDYGEFNAVNIHWSRYEPCVEIVDLYVVRLA